MNTTTKRAMWRAVRAYVNRDASAHQHEMDELVNELTDAEWNTLLRWLSIADAVLAAKEAKPLTIIRQRIAMELL